MGMRIEMMGDDGLWQDITERLSMTGATGHFDGRTYTYAFPERREYRGKGGTRRARLKRQRVPWTAPYTVEYAD